MPPCGKAEARPAALPSPRRWAGPGSGAPDRAAQLQRALPCEDSPPQAGGSGEEAGEEVPGGGPGNCNSLWMGWTGRGGERSQASTSINLPSGRQAGAAAAPALPVSGMIQPNCAAPALHGQGSGQGFDHRSGQRSGQRAPSRPHPALPAGLPHACGDPQPKPPQIPAAAPELNLIPSCPVALNEGRVWSRIACKSAVAPPAPAVPVCAREEHGPGAFSSASKGAQQMLSLFFPFYC